MSDKKPKPNMGDDYWNHYNKKAFPCPCCGEITLHWDNEFDICDNCGWIDDPLQHDDPDDDQGQNSMSLNVAKEYWQKHKQPIPDKKKLAKR